MNMTEFRRKAAQREKDPNYIAKAAKRKRRKPKAKNWYFESWYKWKFRRSDENF